MTMKRLWAGSALALAFLLGTAPMAVRAQPAGEVAAVQKVIKEY